MSDRKLHKPKQLQEDYDFAFHWIEHTDTLHHTCWNDREIVLRFYQEAIEPILSDFLETFPDWNFIIFSDHGMVYPQTLELNINTWLRKQGLLKMKRYAKSSLVRKILSKIDENNPLIQTIPNSILRKLMISRDDQNSSGSSKKVLTDYKNRMVGTDFENTIAYLSTCWGIKIRKENADNYEEIRNRIISRLKNLKHNGVELFQEVSRKEEIFNGKYLSSVPDIVVIPKPEFYLNYQVSSDILERVDRIDPSGDHRYSREGIFLATGPSFKEGEKVENFRLVDLFPTIVYTLDLDLPPNLDGRVIPEIFSEDGSKREIKYMEKNTEVKSKKKGLDKQKEEEIKKKLKSLGYFE